ncbi:hypothetical protein [Nocardia flavorosea]|uniref:Uncharacterized protein n=1 Tax=Nocardia flavorosea TaxID=53429 RepID=A0A846YEB1_9NOCA|nr:hypothetical protein [Nocardia flavorosea]NKY55149.1 hypothetical protein [Nocardia flavorosea]
MHQLLLSVHVLAAIIFVGGSAVATSLFPRYAPSVAIADPASERSPAVAAVLHRITGTYARLALIVPVAGMILAVLQGRLGEIWITAAIILTGCVAAIITMIIHPIQREAMEVPDHGARLRTLGMLAGLYNMLWLIVVVLMIVRPGAHT